MSIKTDKLKTGYNYYHTEIMKYEQYHKQLLEDVNINEEKLEFLYKQLKLVTDEMSKYIDTLNIKEDNKGVIDAEII